MQKPFFSTAYLAAAILLAGCASPPQSTIDEAQQALFTTIEDISSQTLEAGGIAAIGVGKSKSFELARNRAIVNGRLNLQETLDAEMQTLQQKLSKEYDTAQNAQQLDVFRTATQAIKTQIQGSAPDELKHETIDGTVTAYALMRLSPKTIINQLAKEEAFFNRFRTSRAFEELDEKADEYEAYEETLKDAPTEQ